MSSSHPYIPPHKRGNSSSSCSTSSSGTSTLSHPSPSPISFPRAVPTPSAHTTTNWRNNPAPPPPPIENLSALRDIPVGLIACLPRSRNAVAAGDPILSHEDFNTRPNACPDKPFNSHPTVIIGKPNAEGYVLCFQMTSFSGVGGLLNKYPGSSESRRWQRNRWLLVDSSNCTHQNHDGLPLLRTTNGGLFDKQTYVNTEKAFCTHMSNLTVFTNRQGKSIQLDQSAVVMSINHHNTNYNQYANGLLEWNGQDNGCVPNPLHAVCRSVVQDDELDEAYDSGYSSCDSDREGD